MNPLAELVSLLQEANKKYDKLLTLYNHLVNKYSELYQTHSKLLISLSCESCQDKHKTMETEDDGGTVELCHACSQIGKNL